MSIFSFLKKSPGQAIAKPRRVVHASASSGLEEIDKKSIGGFGALCGGQQGFGHQLLASYIALDYYSKIQPVNSAIDMIKEAVSSICPILIDYQTDEISYDHDVSKVLAVPNPFTKYKEFIETVAVNYLVTGNAFIIATGDSKYPVKELYSVNPRFVTIQNATDGHPLRIDVNYGHQESMVFIRRIDEIEGRKVARFVNSNNREIFHIKNPNPYGESDCVWGFSRLTPIVYEMEQYLHTNSHNLSMLVKGVRLSMALSPKEELNQEQIAEVQESLTTFSAGSSNAGALVVLPHGFDMKEMSVSNKDMDYGTLRQNIISAIYTQLGIPLPLVMPEQMTLANMQAAVAQFFNKTVIPVASRIFAELTEILMVRYDDEFEISFDRRSIPSLEYEALESIKTKASLNVMSDNELRADIGLDQLKNGGDVLYKPAGMVPVASAVTESDDELAESINDDDMEEVDEKGAKRYLVKKMRDAKLKDDETVRLFSEKHIKSVVK